MARKKSPPPPSPRLDEAGALCVAFVNTDAAHPENGQLGVASYADLVTWSREAGLIAAREVRELHRLTAERPADAATVYEQAAALRGHLVRLFYALWHKRPVPENDLDGFNAFLPSLGTMRLTSDDGVLRADWSGESPKELERLLGPVVLSALDVLRSPDAACVRVCDGQGCKIHFIDRTPKRRRRWCDPKLCGARTRSLSYYQRVGRRVREDRMDAVNPLRTRRRKSSDQDA